MQATLPVVDLDLFLSSDRQSAAVAEECKKTAEALITYGAVIVHDSRVSESDNDAFLDLLEDYFDQPESELKKDERPELSYQIGVTLENTEKPKCAVDEPCLRIIEQLDPAERPLDISAHSPDPKCRFFWKMGEVPPYKTDFPVFSVPNVVPRAESLRSRWPQTMDKWGKAMMNAIENVSEMTAIGLGLQEDIFRQACRYGPSLLAPTASDLVKYGRKDTILAGFHSDLNLLTIHGRSRYPGLHIWARNTGKRIPVKFPPTGRYLLVQAGKQLEHMTGGLIKAGFHEVVVNDATLQVIQERKTSFPHRPLIRISSTFFWHLSSDFDLAPLPALATLTRSVVGDQEQEYPIMKAGKQVENELKDIALML